MYRPCTSCNLREFFISALLVVVVGGCASAPSTEGIDPAGAESTVSKQGSSQVDSQKREPVNPALVEVDEGVGFTVTEAVSISSDIREDYRYALQLLADGQTESGIELLVDVTDRIPDATAPFVDLGIAYGQSGDHEQAVQAFQSALAATPDHPVAHNELGIAYRRLGQFSDARASYEQALAIYPGFHYARRNLAVLCDLYLADLGCAQEHYENYQSFVHDDPEVAMWLADLRNRISAPR